MRRYDVSVRKPPERHEILPPAEISENGLQELFSAFELLVHLERDPSVVQAHLHEVIDRPTTKLPRSILE